MEGKSQLAYQRVAGFVDVVEAHIAHPRVRHPTSPVLSRANQLVRLGVLLLSSERFDSHEVLHGIRFRSRLLSSASATL